MKLLHAQAFIGGAWVDSKSTFPVTNPATSEVIAEVSNTGASETRSAVDAASRAVASWRGATAHERARILRRMTELHRQHEEELARILTAEQGKPLREAVAEIRYATSFYEWFAEEGIRAYGETIPSPFPGHRLFTVKEPVGVGAAITPWNFPSAMIARKLAPALAAGCTFVLKPSELTPLSALAIAAMAQEAGLPPGVLNVLPTTEARECGEVLLADARVRKLSFTGSTAVGRYLFEHSALTLKKLSLELGGNAPFIVFEDADLDAAVDGLMVAKLRNGGQTCVAANRILVARSVARDFAERLSARMAALTVGRGDTPGVDIGPLINENALSKVRSHVDDARALGAELMTGGGSHALGGTFFEPTVLFGVTSNALMASEETFGPVAGICLFDDEAEAVELANATDAGLAAYFYTRDIGRMYRVADALQVGMVGVSTGLISTAVAPFGGTKFSGFGREGGRQGIDEWMNLKYVCVGGV